MTGSLVFIGLFDDPDTCTALWGWIIVFTPFAFLRNSVLKYVMNLYIQERYSLIDFLITIKISPWI